MQIEIDWDTYTQQLQDTIDQLREDNRKLCETILWYAQHLRYEVETINELPSAHLDIVQCKDCTFHEFYENHHSCEWHGFADVKPDWFCADGERRADG